MNNSDNKSCNKFFSLKNMLKCFWYTFLIILALIAINAVLSEPMKAIVGLLCVIVYQLWAILAKLNK